MLNILHRLQMPMLMSVAVGIRDVRHLQMPHISNDCGLSVFVLGTLVVKGSPYLIAKHRVPGLLGSQPAGDVSHKPGRRLPLLSARPAVTLAAIKRAATNFAAW